MNSNKNFEKVFSEMDVVWRPLYFVIPFKNSFSFNNNVIVIALYIIEKKNHQNYVAEKWITIWKYQIYKQIDITVCKSVRHGNKWRQLSRLSSGVKQNKKFINVLLYNRVKLIFISLLCWDPDFGLNVLQSSYTLTFLIKLYSVKQVIRFHKLSLTFSSDQFL